MSKLIHSNDTAKKLKFKKFTDLYKIETNYQNGID